MYVLLDSMGKVANYKRKLDISIYLLMILHTSSHIIILALFFFFVGNVTKILPQVMTYSLCIINYTFYS